MAVFEGDESNGESRKKKTKHLKHIQVNQCSWTFPDSILALQNMWRSRLPVEHSNFYWLVHRDSKSGSFTTK